MPVYPPCFQSAEFVMATLKEIEHAMKILAKVVSLYSETYLPIFKRLHTEFLKAQEADETKNLAIQIAKQYDETR
jgi:hypothetical protein